ncbi:MAG: acyltransferase [Promicromonosporaceae bacterium]|nr:acyltransferase [Promicromonosporaceae bacterium]
MIGVTEVAARTPQHRLRNLDAIRACSILAVVFGHWLVLVVRVVPAAGGGVQEVWGNNALPELTGLWLVSWLFQVMPLFFLVGGIVSPGSLGKTRARGGTVAQWLASRYFRLMSPATVLVALTGVGAFIATLAGVNPDLISQSVWAVVMPLWFLVIYLIAVLTTPWLTQALAQFKWRPIGALILLISLGDALRLTFGNERLAYLNYLFVYLLFYSLGVAWNLAIFRPRPGLAWLIIGASLGLLLLATGPGPYPTLMVDFAGQGLNNTAPPSLALALLGTGQIASAWLVSPHLQKLLERRPRLWFAVVQVNRVTLTLFLWHMVAAVFGVYLLKALNALPTWVVGGPFGSVDWWLGRLRWLAVLIPILAFLVLIFYRVEAWYLPPLRLLLPERHPLGWVAIGFASCVTGMAWLALSDKSGPMGMPLGAFAFMMGGFAFMYLLATGLLIVPRKAPTT